MDTVTRINQENNTISCMCVLVNYRENYRKQEDKYTTVSAYMFQQHNAIFNTNNKIFAKTLHYFPDLKNSKTKRGKSVSIKQQTEQGKLVLSMNGAFLLFYCPVSDDAF